MQLTRRAKTGDVVQIALIVGPIVVLALLGWSHRFMIEDGFIYLRVVKQVAAGHGPVFNTNQRVEAFTSPAWLALLCVAHLFVRVRLEWLDVLTGLACTVAGATFAALGSRLLARQVSTDAVLIPVGLLVLVGVPPMWTWSTGGLETGLVFGWLGLCVFLLARWARSDDGVLGVPTAVVVGLGWLVRPELAVYSIVLAAVVLGAQWRSDTWLTRVKLVAAMAALPFAYEIFRMGYYGSIVANTAIAKEATMARWRPGWRYFMDFVAPYALWLPIAALVVGAYLPLFVALRRTSQSRASLVAAAFPLAALLNTLYVIRVGGDYLHARFLLPALFAVCAPVALVPATRRFLVAMVALPWALLSGMALRPGAHGSTLFTARGFVIAGTTAPRVTVSDLGWGSYVATWYEGPGLYSAVNISPGGLRRLDTPLAHGVATPVVADAAVGISSFALGTRVYFFDLLGLADPVDAHFRLDHPGFPGHEKPEPNAWIVARLAADGSSIPSRDLPAYPPVITPLLPTTTGPQFAEQVAWARAALQCKAIRRLESSADEPLTVGRFFSNIWDAPANTTLRIPADPQTAYHKFCGPGRPASMR